MKKTISKPRLNMVVLGVVALVALGSCQKSDKITEVSASKITEVPASKFVGDWKLSDLMLVNGGGKRPRKLEELPRLNDLRFIMTPDGQLSTGKNNPGGTEKGTWASSNDSISFMFPGEEALNLKVSRLDAAFMVLEYDFKAADGSHGGTIYYAFAK